MTSVMMTNTRWQCALPTMPTNTDETIIMLLNKIEIRMKLRRQAIPVSTFVAEHSSFKAVVFVM